MKEKKLIGLHFHSLDGAIIIWQGRVISEVRDGFYLVQLYEWFTGDASVMRVASLHAMCNWHFYTTAPKMKEAYEAYKEKRGEA